MCMYSHSNSYNAVVTIHFHKQTPSNATNGAIFEKQNRLSGRSRIRLETNSHVWQYCVLPQASGTAYACVVRRSVFTVWYELNL